MKKTLFIYLMLFSIGLITSCEREQKSVVVYGRNSCDHCTEFKYKMDSAGVKYVFNDLDMSDAYELDIYKLLQEANIRGGVSIPIIHMNGDTLLIAPKFDDFIYALNK